MQNIQICNKCGSNEIACVDSRKNNDYTRRRKKCLCCGNRITTYEISEFDFNKINELKEEMAERRKKLFEEIERILGD